MVDPSALDINSGPGNNMSHIILPNGDPYSYMMALFTDHVPDCNIISLKVTQTSDNKWCMKKILLFFTLKNLREWLDALTWSLILNLLMLIIPMLL